MGAFIAKFRKKPSTFEVLEVLEQRIKDIEEYKSNTELQRKKVVGHLILVSVGLYVIAAVLFYFCFFPATLYDQIFYITPLLIFPIIIIFVKRLLTWYFNRKIRRNQTKLASMKTEKRKLLEQVMDTETYKKAKEILEKFAPEQLRKSGSSNNSMDLSIITPNKSITLSSSSPEIKHRNLPSQAPPSPPLNIIQPTSGPSSLMLSTKTPMPYNMSLASKTPLPNMSFNSGIYQGNKQLVPSNAPVNLPTPRTVLARDRSVMDKMVDYLIGDGPNNRFALICKNCSSHNGMVLREEFEYTSFRCCYCFTYHPARKQRIAAPRLENTNMKELTETTSESEGQSPSDTDSDIELIDPKVDDISGIEKVEESPPKTEEEKKED